MNIPEERGGGGEGRERRREGGREGGGKEGEREREGRWREGQVLTYSLC